MLHRALTTRLLRILAVALAVLGVVALLRDVAAPPTRAVVVARRDVVAGQRFAAADVTVRRVPRGTIPRDAASSAVIGQMARVTVLAGTVVTTRHVAPSAPRVTDDERYVTLPVRDGLVPRPGDVVDIHAVGDTGRAAVVRAATVVRVERIRRVDDRALVTVAVRADDVPALAAAITTVDVVLALVPPG